MAGAVKKFAAERRLAKQRKESGPEISNDEIFSALRSVNATIQAGFKEAYARIEKINDTVETSVPEEVEGYSVTDLREELHGIMTHISTTKSEIAALKPKNETDSDQISAATGELDAVVESTAAATSDILKAAEEIQTYVEAIREEHVVQSVENLDKHLDCIEMEGMNVLMACGFQDLTGQRINKVVNTLRYIEDHIDALIKVWGITEGTAEGPLIANAPDDSRPDQDLLHGPSTDGSGVSQDDIDALFD
jgi:chemotaxis regulatin CheY-phosphate phosphatase CheZ